MEDIEDTDYVASEHDTLVSAISKLDKTQHITEPTRNEPTKSNSEFNLLKRSNKLDLNEVAELLEGTATHMKISKKLKRAQDSAKVLPKPLEKPEAERIKRATGYEHTKKKVGRWDPVVSRARAAEYNVFPIKSLVTKLEPSNEFLARFELKSELERELEEVDPPMMVEEEEEEEKIYPMSYEEMVEQRQNTAKLRAKQSYKEAKAKRQSKIKSKKFHRVLKKEKLKQQLKEFEELQKTNPEEALKKLEAIEKARALERHTLRHKNTGKWAKNQLIRAKYDKDVRQQIAEQLAVSRNLTKKTNDIESSDDDGDDNPNIPDLNITQDPMNPWMTQQSNKSNINAEFNFGYKKYLQDKMQKRKKQESDSDSESDGEDNTDDADLSTLKEKINKISKLNEEKNQVGDNNDISKLDKLVFDVTGKLIKPQKGDERRRDRDGAEKEVMKETIEKPDKNIEKKTSKSKVKKVKEQNTKSKVKKAVSATTSWVVEEINSKPDGPVQLDKVFESLENQIVDKVEKKLKALRNQIKSLENKPGDSKPKKAKEQKEFDNTEYLKLKNQKSKIIIDEELIETGHKITNKPADEIEENFKVANAPTTEPSSSNIDPNRFIEVKPKYLNTTLPQGANDMDLLDDDEQVVPRVNIEEVFEEDDVVASFRQEKEDEINKDKPELLDLSLPGWGSWGGKGIKPPTRKRNRFITKHAVQLPRKDENKGDIIIKEYRESKLISHKVKDVPFPFTTVKDYEASIRAPIGNTFIPESAHKKLIRPSVITKAGAIIEPMDEDELLQKKNRVFAGKMLKKRVLKIKG